MIRERVNFDGVCRPLEPESELGAMVMPSDEIGMIKEGPALRYIEGQAIWDKRFRHTRKRIARHRKKNLAKAHDRDAKTLRDRWSKVVTDVPESDVSSDEDPLTWCDRNAEHLPADSSWAWQWALGGEQPPPSAIVGRRDLVSVIEGLLTISQKGARPRCKLTGWIPPTTANSTRSVSGSCWRRCSALGRRTSAPRRRGGPPARRTE